MMTLKPPTLAFRCEVCQHLFAAETARRCRVGAFTVQLNASEVHIPTDVLHVCEDCYDSGIEDGACHPFDCDSCGTEIPYSETPNWTDTLMGRLCDQCCDEPG